MSYVNISGYKFINLTNLPILQEKLKSICHALELKGTILLSFEGINIFLSGSEPNIEEFIGALKPFDLGHVEFKKSPSQTVPFKHLRVKIKAEIVTFGVPDIYPATTPAPNISAQELKTWLDNQENIILLDTRNHYEVRIGKFSTSIDLNIQNFREFPEAVQKLPEEFKEKTVVTFCTGGIRCEKAAPYLMQAGFKKVFQLQGGILKYFEEVGMKHFEGTCFVFDKRIAINSALEETNTLQCIACREPVTEPQQAQPEYIHGKSCPNCYNSL